MRRIAIVFVVFALVLTACQSVSENIAESITEKALDSVDGVDGVDINVDTGEVSIETEDVTIRIGGGEIPDGFPIPAPDGGTVLSVFESEGNANVTLSYPGGNFDEVVGYYDEWTDSQPTEWEKSSNTVSTEEGDIKNASWGASEGGGFITVSNLCTVADDSANSQDCVAVSLGSGNG